MTARAVKQLMNFVQWIGESEKLRSEEIETLEWNFVYLIKNSETI